MATSSTMHACQHMLSRPSRPLHTGHNARLGHHKYGRSLTVTAAVDVQSQPSWTGDAILSKVVNFIIFTPPLSNLVNAAGRYSLRSSATKAGIDWPGYVKRMEATKEVYDIKAELEDPSIQYPDYYLKPFHTYEQGNLNWEAAFEVEPVSFVIALRAYKTEQLSPEAALTRIQQAINKRVQAYQQQYNLRECVDIVDVGCSVGVSTRGLAQEFPAANITGLDLSPHFLAVAEYREREEFRRPSPPSRPRIKYVHGLAEAMQVPDQSVDLLSFQFMMHECPAAAIRSIFTEAKRVLRPGGIVALIDSNPKSQALQNLPPVLFTAMKASEPWADEYYGYDLEGALEELGFKDIVEEEATPRHKAVLAHL